MKVLMTNQILVKIYSDRKAMRRAIRRIGYKCDHTEAMVIPCTVYACLNPKEKCKKVPMCGEMYIHKNASMPVLVHETLHAATTVIRQQKKSLNLGLAIRKPEERLAYTQTAILQDILKHFFPRRNSAYMFGNLADWVNGSVKENRK